MPATDDKRRTIAFVIYPGVTLLELIGPLTVFFGLTRGLVMPSHRYRTVTVAEQVQRTDSDTPMALVPEATFEDVPDPFAVIVPGGGMAALEAMGNQKLLDYLRFAQHGAAIVGSISTGAFILAAAGLLRNRQATTNPAYGALLERLGTTYVAQDWLQDSRFITAAGVSGALDMSLHLVAQLSSERNAKDVQLVIEYDPDPPFDGIHQDGHAGQDWLTPTLVEHRSRLESALSGRPDLYEGLFG
jgi:transcriptional regulator GlxA family with amidase domain